MQDKEKIIDGILEINFRLRTLEESLANILNLVDANVNLEKVTDTATLEAVPITSAEGMTQIHLRLDEIESAIHSLVPHIAVSTAQAILQYKSIIQKLPED